MSQGLLIPPRPPGLPCLGRNSQLGSPGFPDQLLPSQHQRQEVLPQPSLTSSSDVGREGWELSMADPQIPSRNGLGGSGCSPCAPWAERAFSTPLSRTSARLVALQGPPRPSGCHLSLGEGDGKALLGAGCTGREPRIK